MSAAGLNGSERLFVLLRDGSRLPVQHDEGAARNALRQYIQGQRVGWVRIEGAIEPGDVEVWASGQAVTGFALVDVREARRGKQLRSS
jgi:hypothetical protein